MNKIIVLGFFLCFSLSTVAQEQNKKKVDYKQIQQLRKSFITEKLSLQPEQSEKFWPLYNKYRKQTLALNKSKNEIQKTIQFKNITEEQAESISTSLFEKEKQILELKIQMTQDLKSILSSKQILKLKLTEINFKKKLLEHIKKKKKQDN